MQKKRSVMLLIASTVTTVAIIVFVMAMMALSVENNTEPYDEYVIDMIYLSAALLATIVSAIILWIAYGMANSSLALAASIVLTVFLIVNVYIFPIPLILSYIGFGMQNKINKNVIQSTENHNQNIMF